MFLILLFITHFYTNKCFDGGRISREVIFITYSCRTVNLGRKYFQSFSWFRNNFLLSFPLSSSTIQFIYEYVFFYTYMGVNETFNVVIYCGKLLENFIRSTRLD